MLRPPDLPLTDGVVTLRPFQEEDVPEVVAACRDPEIPRWTRVPEDYTDADGRAFLATSREGWASGTDAAFVIADAETQELLGAAGIHGIAGGTGEVGYWVRRESRGLGVAPRAVRLLSCWALTEIGLARLELLAEPANLASQRVAEKAGFARESLVRSFREIKGRRRDFVIFSLLPGDLD